MSFAHPLDALATVAGVADAEQRASAAIAAVHRRPVNLRRSEITSSESAVRGARLSALLSGGSEDAEVSAYSLLAPAQLQATARTFQRAPLQVLARLDALLGGSGTPLSGASRLSTLAQLIVGPAHPREGWPSPKRTYTATRTILKIRFSCCAPGKLGPKRPRG